MNNRFLRTALVLTLAATISGCLATSPQVSYYSLYAPARKPASAATDNALGVSVGQVTIPDILKQAQIATGGADGRYRLAEYNRWSGEVDRDLARTLAEHLAAELGTERVAVYPWDQNLTPTCRVLVDVLSMGGEPGREATLAVRWSLLDPQGKRPSVIRRSKLSEVPGESGYGAWVTAQQRNLAKLGQEVATAIRENVKP